jgi:hypothetical protein
MRNSIHVCDELEQEMVACHFGLTVIFWKKPDYSDIRNLQSAKKERLRTLKGIAHNHKGIREFWRKERPSNQTLDTIKILLPFFSKNKYEAKI